jgi:hypothetical protein
VISKLSCYLTVFLCVANPTITKGFPDKLRHKKDRAVKNVKEQTTSQPTHSTKAQPPPGIRIKKYTPEGKPIYE